METASRDIAPVMRVLQDCGSETVAFMALSGDSAPHFTTVTGLIREPGEEISNIFTRLLFICDAQGLIGREMFAIDGVFLPYALDRKYPNAPRAWAWQYACPSH